VIQAVLWDFGGVLTTSPFEAFARFEGERGLPEGFIRAINARDPDHNAWARFERGQIGVGAFDQAFLAESRAAGHPVRGAEVLALLSGTLRPEMLEALRRCRERFKTACLTNNFRSPGPARSGGTDAEDPAAPTGVMERVRPLFDVVIESSVLGVRKPDPRFYAHALEVLEVEARSCIFLDDLGINLKPARRMGMHTIKVIEPDRALAELEDLVGIPLRD